MTHDPHDSPSVSNFSDFGLNETLVQTLATLGYAVPTAIQAQTIPLLLQGDDVLGTAQTGTGKTAAFALPMLQRIDLSRNHPQVLVLTPTRELAIQVSESFEKYAAGMKGLRVAAIYGGQDYQVQFRKLSRGAHVIVGTPGRVMDHMRRESLVLSSIQGLVLDEADEMLRMGFAEDVEHILGHLPEQRQIALFSATMPDPIRRIAAQHLRSPAEINIRRKATTAETIRQRFVVATIAQKQAVLQRILEVEPIDGVLVFVKTRTTCEPLAESLTRSGYRAAALHGDIAQKQRERIIDQLRSGNLDVIVATDVAARGLDVPRISHVFNYDLPFDSEAYVHRIGRTGRAGRSGEAILFVSPRERMRLKRLEQATRQSIEPMELPTNRDINKRRIAKFHARLEAALEHKDIEAFLSIVEQFRRTREDVTIEQVAAALAVLANGENSLLERSEWKPASFQTEDRSDRGRNRSGYDRDERGPRSASRERGGPSRNRDEAMETFRIEVGRNHGVSPGNIVGAIANEIGIDSAYIGRIEIRGDHSMVDLPEGLPNDLFQALQRVHVLGKKLNISRSDATRGPNDERRGPKERASQRPSSASRSAPSTVPGEAKKKSKKRRPTTI
jgi:ATP-dependent RNA helicase DeaD